MFVHEHPIVLVRGVTGALFLFFVVGQAFKEARYEDHNQ